jgi:AAA+ superfamily predicted ATPase
VERFFEQRANVKTVCGIRRENAAMFGMGATSLSDLLSQDTTSVSVPLEYEEVDIGEDAPVRCLGNALWLARSDGAKIAVLLSKLHSYSDQPKVRFDVAAENNDRGRAFCTDFFQTLEESVRKAESYRGKVLSLENNDDYTGESTGITVHKVPGVTRDDVILPSKTLELLERNVVQFVEQRKRLAELGQSTKKGLLFFGPPGNGKTLTIRYLIGELAGHTTLLITAEQMARLGEYMTLARLLEPSIVVVEDVDLIARHREDSCGPVQESLLNQLLNEMDGLKEDCDTIVLLTTNRPEQLETALASRPGRVDQVIEFPLPDAEGRRKLVNLYSGSVQVSDDLVDLIVEQTDGVSAAFIKELMRRAIQFHLAKNAEAAIDSEDIRSALDELMVVGGRLNQRILGLGVQVHSNDS